MSELSRFFIELGERWQRRWREARVFEPEPAPGVPKYFITAAYPYPNGAIHIGHGRTYLVADVMARFQRHLGRSVLFPMGFHYTGTPILTIAEVIAAGDKAVMEEYMELYGVPEEEIKKMGDPLYLARYFHGQSKRAMERFGLSIDWTREFTTIDPEYQRFIQWQFEKLRKKGLIVRGRHPVGWCPRHSMPVGAHDTKDDKEPDIGQWTLVYFTDSEGLTFPTATLRPETVLGVTNLWINPDAEYVVAEFDGRRAVVSRDAAYRLSFQVGVKILREARGREFVGRMVQNPVTGEWVPVYEARFVDPKVGTGVVMSVPAHAPYDYAALRDLGTVKLIPLIRVEGYGDYPAKEVVERMGIKSQADPALEDATKEVYSAEYARGVMREDVAERVGAHLEEPARSMLRAVFKMYFAGRPVREAREFIARWLTEARLGGVMYDIMNKPVYCRCGTEIVVKVLEDQWFINYGESRWKEAARELVKEMSIVPGEARAQFLATIDWLDKRACARTRGLGTPLPWSSGWVIESLSDSTIYMAFYTVVKRIRQFGIRPEQLTEEFWDFVFLGQGSADEVSKKTGVPVEALKAIREEFEYWYPLDSRNSGKDLIPNHLTFFIFNHVAIFPREKWPRQIVANGWVLREGEKMSKSKRNVLPLDRAVEMYGPDPLRATLALAAEVEQDLDFRDAEARRNAQQLMSIYTLAQRLVQGAEERPPTWVDQWLVAEISRVLERAREAYEKVRVRQAAVEVLYNAKAVFDQYLAMVEKPSRQAVEAAKAWAVAMEPLVPHLAEELWATLGGAGFAALAPWPKLRAEPAALLAKRYVDMLIEDVKNIPAFGQGAKRVVIYVNRSFAWVKAALAGDVKTVIGAGVPPQQAKKVVDLVKTLGDEMRGLIAAVDHFDELEALRSYRNYVEKALGAPVEIYGADDPAAPDLGGKKRVALPLKPGIYVEK
ncbi:leucine--tRNA ligase [Pyrobaculum neutrophilum]|uniref:Leucine--tRNA ligase n=1 Tax=Pyrobaculum neutrophilum (strain DSM 2338 / JCM 9278 / NBRC 100436 / V24Sta) TaxID=444157 RepID=SYL_PYRNV|nr:leucine--tRNA ligase [Pyrobaculum neutrophilum]B1YAS9.1 RecName: Full=Leucine--tRNA ligase; AltName: Full=Leucyl-tRNA synthetase; Short=LeuRS [Pyrobaculum neutrophilum V24Sta]ACB39158.1 leucyl-tRNA synthetase [Pyrobaculum neutrophilum V24Sta]